MGELFGGIITGTIGGVVGLAGGVLSELILFTIGAFGKKYSIVKPTINVLRITIPLALAGLTYLQLGNKASYGRGNFAAQFTIDAGLAMAAIGFVAGSFGTFGCIKLAGVLDRLN